jgi:hypothetical protein
MNKKLAIQVWIVAVVAVFVAVNVHSRTYPHIVDNRAYPPVYVAQPEKPAVPPEPYQRLIKTDTEQGISYQYPNRLDSDENWNFSRLYLPPMVTVEGGVFSCKEGDEMVGNGVHIGLRVINGREYCVVTEPDYAMGSRVLHLRYTTQAANKIVTFSTIFYYNHCRDSAGVTPEVAACREEEKNFSLVQEKIDQVIDGIAQSIKFTN